MQSFKLIHHLFVLSFLLMRLVPGFHPTLVRMHGRRSRNHNNNSNSKRSNEKQQPQDHQVLACRRLSLPRPVCLYIPLLVCIYEQSWDTPEYVPQTAHGATLSNPGGVHGTMRLVLFRAHCCELRAGLASITNNTYRRTSHNTPCFHIVG